MKRVPIDRILRLNPNCCPSTKIRLDEGNQTMEIDSAITETRMRFVGDAQCTYYECYCKLGEIDDANWYIWHRGDKIHAIKPIELINVHKLFGGMQKFRCDQRCSGECIVKYKVKSYDITSYLNVEHIMYFGHNPPRVISNIIKEDIRTRIIDTICGIENDNEEWY